MTETCTMFARPYLLDSGTTRPSRRTLVKELSAQKYVDEYSDMILRLSYSYLGNTADAEDICQEVLIKFMLNAPVFSDEEHEKAWILRTAINQCKDVLKSSSRTTTVPFDETIAHPRTASAEEELLSEQSDLLALMQSLSPDQRDAVYLYYYEDLSIKEISRITHKSEAAIAKQLSRARDALRSILKG